MYSQCPQCQAIFKVPETDIGAHHGLVRCGHCAAVFHAVTNEVGDVQIPFDEEPASLRHDVPQAPDEDELSSDVERRHETAGSPVRESSREPGQAGRDVDQTLELDLGFSRRPRREEVDDERAGLGPWSERDTGARLDPRVEAERAPPSQVEDPGSDEAGDRDPDPVEAPGSALGAADLGEDPFEGQVMEEILIEAPRVLWDAFDEEDESAPGSVAPGPELTGVPEEPALPPGEKAVPRRPASVIGKAARAIQPMRRREAPAQPPLVSPAAPVPARRASLKSPYRARDIQMVELPQPRPFKTASLSLLALFLALLMVWQVKTFYLGDLAQVSILRPYLELMCRPLGCVVPPRRDFAAIDLVGTSIDVNPDVPGALQIKARLINRAHFPQPYPLLRVTLSDSDGRIVGRRTYLPSEYRSGEPPALLPVKEMRSVSIGLAHPAESAVGYEVELMPPRR